jgi:hypothetical protein
MAARTTKTTGFIHLGGRFLTQQIVLQEDSDFAICGYAGRMISEGVDLATARWFNRRGLTEIASKRKWPLPTEVIEIMDKDGNLTDWGNAINDAPRKDRISYTTEEFLLHMEKSGKEPTPAEITRVKLILRGLEISHKTKADATFNPGTKAA